MVATPAMGRLWDAAVTLLAAQSQLGVNDTGVAPLVHPPTIHPALEVTALPYTNVRGVPCVWPLVTHEFANSYGAPAVETFAPPACNPDYSVAYLVWSAACPPGVQFDRIAAVWANGVELLRTSTEEPSRRSGAEWRVTKDISLYADVIRAGGTIVVALDNIVNPTYTSSFEVELSVEFYRPLDVTREQKRPDRVIPVSRSNSSYGWFTEAPRAPGVKPPRRLVQLPANTEELYLELFLSHHQCDEFFYANPPDNYAQASQSTSNSKAEVEYVETNEGGSVCGAGGPFREVQVLVDGELVGVVWPFPLVFTGGLSPYLWKPIVAIGAFDAPTYVLNMTPFLGKFLAGGGKPHTVAFRVAYGAAFWPIDGNLLVFEDVAAMHQTKVHVLEEKFDRTIEPEVTATTFVGADTDGVNSSSSTAFSTSASREVYVKTNVTTSSGSKIFTLHQHLAFTNVQVYSDDELSQKFDSRTRVETELTVACFAPEVLEARGVKLEMAPEPTLTTVRLTEDYPMSGSISYRLGANESFVLEVQLSNAFSRSTAVGIDGVGFRYGYSPGKVHAELAASAVLDSRYGGNGSTRAAFASASPAGECFCREVAAAFGRLTDDRTGTECSISL